MEKWNFQVFTFSYLNIPCIKVFQMRSFSVPHNAEKCRNSELFIGPCFRTVGLNTKIFSVNLCFHSECGKIRTRENYEFGHFSRSGIS